MEEVQHEPGSSSAAYPRWVMLEQCMEIIKVAVNSSCSPIDNDDAKTLVAARTSAGHPIQVSLRVAEPPALSRVVLQIPDGLEGERSKVLAAHGDSVLIQVRIKEKYEQSYTAADHFVYCTGAARTAVPPRPPSLRLLPPAYYEEYEDLEPRELFDGCTGLLRLCEDDDDELVVAELRTCHYDMPTVASLCLFHSGEWSSHEFETRGDCDLPMSWDTVVPVNDRLLCFVDLCRGVALLDAFNEMPRARYVRLPIDARQGSATSNRNVCVTAGGGTLKFVNIFGRCCCGAAASCGCSRHAYTIHTWTMRIGSGNGRLEWVKDGMVDATELWALDAHKGLPCNPLDRPIVSMDQPDVICFRLRAKDGSRTLWQILVNMRSKTILSVSRHEGEDGYCYARDKLIPSNVSYFFNTLTGGIQIVYEKPPAVAVDEQLIIRDDDSSNPTLQPSSVAELASVQALLEIFDALEKIPGLGPDEVRAYRILISDNGRRLRSLLRLPKDLRKDWLLMEIKAADAN